MEKKAVKSSKFIKKGECLSFGVSKQREKGQFPDRGVAALFAHSLEK